MTHQRLVSSANEDEAEIIDGGPWDVLFLVSEVTSAAAAGHFSFDYCTPRAQRSLAWLCAKAILSRYPAFHWLVERADFLVVRHCGETVAAALICFNNTNVGQPGQVAILGYLAVEQRFRGRGFGTQLIRAIQTRISPRMSLHCWCTPFSQSMQRLLARLGFVRAHDSKTIQVDGTTRVVVPSLWVWEHLEQSQHLRGHSLPPAKAPSATEPRISA